MSQLPLISIVIPTYGRPEKLRRCLESIRDLEYPRDRFEAIVVDDGSPVPVAPSVSSLGATFQLRLLRQENQGPAVARNRGMNAASGTLIAFTDDDCRPRQDWLQQLATAHLARPQAALGGRVHNALDRRICSESSQMLVDYLYDYFGTLTKGGGFFTSNNLTFPAEALKRMGGFDETFPLAAGEDREICDRWSRQGLPLSYVPNAIVDHFHDLNLRRFVRQQFNYGRGAYYFHQTRQRHTNAEHRIEPARFYLGLLRYPFGRHSLPRSVPMSLLMGVSQAANATGYFYQRFTQPVPVPESGKN